VTRRLRIATAIQRSALALYGLGAGGASVLAIIVPQLVAKAITGKPLAAPAIVASQLYTGMRLGLAVVAIIAATMPRPARSLTAAVMIGLAASLAGPLLSALFATVPWTELAPLKKLLIFDALILATLVGTRSLSTTRR
jgi:hypothetical protein